MNPGPVEEVGKAGGIFMSIMKDQPLSLALVIMNVALLILFYIIMQAVTKTREREVNLMYEDHKEVRELLAKCVIPKTSLPLPKIPSVLGFDNVEKRTP